MKKQILILSLTLITIGLLLITSSISSAQSPNDITVPLTDPAKRGKLKAHLNYGSITVKGTARKDVLVRYKSVEDNDDHDHHCEDCDENDNDNKNKNTEKSSKSGLRRIGGGGMDLEVIESNNYVKVQSDSWNHKINLEIEVPTGMDMEVHTYNEGDLMITNIQGELALTNYNGEITALNISGSVIATTYNGEIKVTFDKVSDNTPMSFSTYNGDIDLTFPSTLKASLKMKTEQGEILTDFDVNMVSTGPVTQKDVNRGYTKIKIDDWKRGNVNGGGPEFTMKNYNGDILIRKK
jgi:hypothetical protein